MALAALCSRMIRVQGELNVNAADIKLQAFVVDHRAREKSDIEAGNVAKILERHGEWFYIEMPH